MEELGVDVSALAQRAQRACKPKGCTVSWLAELARRRRRVLGLLAFGDTLKPTRREAIGRLHAQGIRTVMVTGDNRGSAAGRGRESSASTRCMREVLPAGQGRAHRAASSGTAARVAMVGDGINDAPALAAADVGIAHVRGTGTDVAMHAAGITLMRGDPSAGAPMPSTSRAAPTRKIRQNLFWAFVYNVVGIPLAAFGLLSPVIAGAAMAFSSVSVVTNALLLRRGVPRRCDEQRATREASHEHRPGRRRLGRLAPR